MQNNSANKLPHSYPERVAASPGVFGTSGSLPGASPAGSHLPGNPSHMGRMEQSNIMELSHS